MKFALLLLLLIISNPFLFGIHKKPQQITSNFYYMKFVYDDQGRIIRHYRGQGFGVGSPYTNVGSYTYDSAGRVLTESWQDWEAPGRWVIYSSTVFIYNNIGNLVNKVTTDRYGKDSTIYYYDSLNILRTVITMKVNSIIENYRRYLYMYNDSGKVHEILTESWYNQMWRDNYLEIYSYDSLGFLAEYLTFTPNDSLKWIPSFRLFYQFNSSGKEIYKLWQNWNIDKWGNNVQYKTTYDSTGIVLNYREDEWLSNDWSLCVDMNYTYDNDLDPIAGSGIGCATIFTFPVFFNDTTFYLLGSSFTVDYNITSAENQISRTYNYSLMQNYPNPFNPSTTINYSIGKDSFVKLKIYDALGREVNTLVNEVKQAGNYSIQLNGNNYSAGVYFYRIEAGEFTQTKKLLLLK